VEFELMMLSLFIKRWAYCWGIIYQFSSTSDLSSL